MYVKVKWGLTEGEMRRKEEDNTCMERMEEVEEEEEKGEEMTVLNDGIMIQWIRNLLF